MATRKRAKNVPLIIEPHPEDYEGYPFITLLQYRTEHFLTIVDNVDNKHVRAYVLDYCAPTQVNEELVIYIANEWYTKEEMRYPLSFEFSKRGLANQVAPIYRKFTLDFISRVIGSMNKFAMNEVKSTKRRRRKEIPAGVDVQNKVVKLR